MSCDLSFNELEKNYQENIISNTISISPNKKVSPFSSDGSLVYKSSLSKPMRRRSRASKKRGRATTHVNANTHNFQALVQQFTGCDHSISTSYKGPVNLNFAHYNNSSCAVKSDEPHHQQQQQQQLEQPGAENEISREGSDHQLSVSTSEESSVRPDQLMNLDVFEMESFSCQDLLVEPGYYPDPLTGMTNYGNDFWGVLEFV